MINLLSPVATLEPQATGSDTRPACLPSMMNLGAPEARTLECVSGMLGQVWAAQACP